MKGEKTGYRRCGVCGALTKTKLCANCDMVIRCAIRNPDAVRECLKRGVKIKQAQQAGVP